ncbi:ATP-dependent helicase [Edwardsiella anguillarum]|uniref:DNA 3'-5' helicase II n=1 Tax=Edwardsiella anguillarum ET080813 TaxID=667120 RepID=A0A076LMF2_9GAMM|nr:ATP-dependent helicase [Edwardsiella anguillarum]AIJ09006.1 Superfamily I DNA and RNA helicases-like protein [Edwardsiella anguillarum ET080813]UOU79898.1 ATP-dependent helicase [Edwardsiella anguillarum]
MAVRKYLNYFISDLVKLASDNQSDTEILHAILEELSFRKKSLARRELTDEIHGYLQSTVAPRQTVSFRQSSLAEKLPKLEVNQAEKDILTGKFNTSEIPNRYRRAVLNTTHMHNFRKENLLRMYLDGTCGIDASAIRKVIEFFLHGDIVVQSSQTAEKKMTTAFINTHKLNDVAFSDDVSNIGVGKINKIENEIVANKSDFYQAALDKCVILSAPPGCGKTYSIVERLANHVMCLKEPYDAKKILVLSFTRNAVKELRLRLEKRNQSDLIGSLDLVRVMTFDALAYSILQAIDSDLPSDDFDANIRMAKSIIMQEKIANVEVLKTVKWIYVDEYQDLVGCRADFTIELMKLALTRDGAVSLLGDPCQQIMNFQLKHRNETTNDAFLHQFKCLAAKQLLQYRLNESYRFITTEQKERVKQITSQLVSEHITEINSHDYAQMVTLDEINEGDAVLCMRNIDCYLISQQLTQRGFSVRLQAGCDKSELPIWLYRVFAGWRQEIMSVELFLQKCQTILGHNGEEELDYLCRAGVVMNNNVLVNRLVQNAEKYSAISPIVASNQIIVSTVHKAKGLQFPRVFFYSNNTHFSRNGDSMNTFYVAVTRAEQYFFILNDSAIKAVRCTRGGMYIVGQSLLLEGINDIDFKSFIPEPETFSSGYIDSMLRGEVRYFVSYHENKTWLFAEMNNKTTIRLYRMPRLERNYWIQNQNRYYLNFSLVEMSTFVYSGDSELIEKIVGPTYLLPLPVFKGLWEI